MDFKRILITGPLYKEIQEIIERDFTLDLDFRFIAEEDVTSTDFHWAEVYVNFGPDERFQFGNLKWVHSLGAGVDRFTSLDKWNQEVLLTRTVCSFGTRISEYCLSYILRDLQLHNTFEKLKELKEWVPHEPKLLKTQKVIIFGTGEIGQEIAKTFTNLGMSVIGVSRSGELKSGFEEVITSGAKMDFLGEVNWVINTMPLTNQTEYFFNDEFFSKLEGPGFINVGRGKSVDQKSLIAALNSKSIRIAILDVFEEEPLPSHSPLWNREDIIITPHISAVTTPFEAVQCFVETLKALKKGETIQNIVDINEKY